MTRWTGLILLLASIPIFLKARKNSHAGKRKLLDRRASAVIFLMGVFGLCLLVFGSVARAGAVVAIWCIIAWAYNR